MKKRLVIFDFDGTITYKDTFLEFMKFYKGRKAFYSGFAKLSPIMGMFLFKLIPNYKAKEAAISHFFKGEDISEFNRKCQTFSENIIPNLIIPKALDAILTHQKEGARLIVVSASAENWLAPWCEKINLELIATKLEVEEGKITGRLSGRNCYGEEKECRLKEVVELSDYDEIYVYGDSSGDKSILKLATHPHFKFFN